MGSCIQCNMLGCAPIALASILNPLMLLTNYIINLKKVIDPQLIKKFPACFVA